MAGIGGTPVAVTIPGTQEASNGQGFSDIALLEEQLNVSSNVCL